QPAGTVYGSHDVEPYEDELVQDAGGSQDEDADIAELEVEIAQTRAELSATIDEIQARLNPDALKEQAFGQIADTRGQLAGQAKEAPSAAPSGGAEKMANSGAAPAREPAPSIGEPTRKTRSRAARGGGGGGWFFWTRRGGDTWDRRYDGYDGYDRS